MFIDINRSRTTDNLVILVIDGEPHALSATDACRLASCLRDVARDGVLSRSFEAGEAPRQIRVGSNGDTDEALYEE